MKAILVIDIGNEKELLNKKIVSINFQDGDKIYDNFEYLKPMPYRYVEDKVRIETPRDVEVCTHGIQIGRNMVINEILGEEEE